VKVLVFGSLAGSRSTTGGQEGDDKKEGDGDRRDDGAAAASYSVELLVKKLSSLNASRAGPFDAAFVVGSCSPDAAASLVAAARDDNHHASAARLPIPVYLHHVLAAAAAAAAQSSRAAVIDGATDVGPETENGLTVKAEGQQQQQPFSRPRQLAPNLFCLLEGDDDPRAAMIWSLSFSPNSGGSSSSGPQLVVAACPPRYRAPTGSTEADGTAERSSSSPSSRWMRSAVDHPSYRGCDLLLSVEAPQGAESLLPGIFALGGGGVSYDVADAALRSRARYHFFPSDQYGQSGPFRHAPSSASTSEPAHPGRIVGLAPVSARKEKERKCVHALGLAPLLSMSALELEEQQHQGGNLLPCPFTDAGYEPDASGNCSSRRPGHAGGRPAAVAGLSEASARRIMAEEERQRQRGFVDGSSRWSHPAHGGRRSHSDGHGSSGGGGGQDPDNSTLFVHGLQGDASGRLQSSGEGDELLRRAFSRFGVVRGVRRPAPASAAAAGGGGAPAVTSSSFCFVEMGSHRDAARCLEETGGRATVAGVPLTVRWGTKTTSKRGGGGEGSDRPDGGDAKKPRRDYLHPERLTESEAKESTALYFKISQSSSSHDCDSTGEAMRSWAEAILEAALNEGATDEEERVTAKDEPALRVQARILESFGFLDFASHAAASMAIATLTGSVDGGKVLEDGGSSKSGSGPAACPDAIRGATIYVHWAHARAGQPDRAPADNLVEDASGFKFERRHFPADSRHDCWFCLASDSCERHLITGVYESCYAAMPKGPVHPGHILLVPIRHTSQGALRSAPVSAEMDGLKARLREHASAEYDCDLFVFERAVQTRGGYHTHVQCVPVPRQVGQRLATTMQAQAGKAGMDLKEIKSDIGASALLADDDEDHDESEGYFYAEVPTAGCGFRRFLHRQVPGRHRGGTIPLQLGREVVAAVLEKPELAHWKSCLLEKEEETKLATQFRESFGLVGVM
jgi:diadenosine tetraphosphate (Ap4A) HIT family hydrolase